MCLKGPYDMHVHACLTGKHYAACAQTQTVEHVVSGPPALFPQSCLAHIFEECPAFQLQLSFPTTFTCVNLADQVMPGWSRPAVV